MLIPGMRYWHHNKTVKHSKTHVIVRLNNALVIDLHRYVKSHVLKSLNITANQTHVCLVIKTRGRMMLNCFCFSSVLINCLLLRLIHGWFSLFVWLNNSESCMSALLFWWLMYKTISLELLFFNTHSNWQRTYVCSYVIGKYNTMLIEHISLSLT